jgi:hypothetical protein
MSEREPTPTGAPGWSGYNTQGLNIASAGRRLGGSLLDALLLLVTLGIGWMVWSIVVWGQGQTPAKALLKMRCIRTDNRQAAGRGAMALREIVGKSILGSISCSLTTLVSAYFIIKGGDRQAVWDRVADVVVVDER